MSEVVIEPAIFEDLDELSNLLGELFSEEKDFRPNKQKQLQGLRLIFEDPSRGRVFVLRRDRTIVAMINLLFTISTAEGGFVILLEDLVVHDSFRGHGYGSQLLEYAIDFAKKKKFLRITLLTDRPELRSQNFFKRHGFYESPMLPALDADVRVGQYCQEHAGCDVLTVSGPNDAQLVPAGRTASADGVRAADRVVGDSDRPDTP